MVFGLYPLQTTKIHNQDRLLLTKSLTARFTQSSQPNLWLCTGDLTGVNISPYFPDACQGKGFGFHSIWGKVLRCKLTQSGFSPDFSSKLP